MDTHDPIERLLTLLEPRKVNSPDALDLVNDMLEVTDRHISRANAALRPALRQALTTDELTVLGRRITFDEGRLLTHPHPIPAHPGRAAAVLHRAAHAVDAIHTRSPDTGRTSSSQGAP
jgi:hypothetical protein